MGLMGLGMRIGVTSVTPASMSCPPWLQTAIKSRNHIREVVTTLDERQTDRELATSYPRTGSQRSSRRFSKFIPRTSVSGPAAKVIPEYQVSEGSKRENVCSNRYINLEPFDRTRVVVHGFPPVDPGRYINSNWVRELYGGQWWIASQAPLPNTAHTFLSILLQPETRPPSNLDPSQSLGSGPCQVRTVIQLTLNEESGRTKADPYFHSEIGLTKLIESDDDPSLLPLKISLIESEALDDMKCIRSKVHLAVHTDDPSKRRETTFQHLLYTAWPDHGVPSHSDKASLLRFIQYTDAVNRNMSGLPRDAHPNPPMIVGCSAGIGRTGAFISLCSLLRESGFISKDPQVGIPPPLPTSPLGPLPETIAGDKVAQEIDALREQRRGMVQRNEQVILVYELLQDVFTM